MCLDSAFRLSTYLTLGLAYAALGYAEAAYLSEVGFFVVPAVLLILLTPALEQRWTLSIRSANLLGLLIAVGVGAWIGPPFLRALNAPNRNVLVPSTVLPFVGPLLMALVLVKAYRPKKLADYWVLHGLGLLLVALGCTLASDPVFGGLLLAYFASALWSLSLFHLYREHLRAAAPGPHAPQVPWRFQGLFRAGRWAAGVLVLGFLLFFLTPRHGDARWNLFNLFASELRAPRLRTGLAQGGIDLNRTGFVEVNDEVALEVHARDARSAPIADLDDGQRWRAEVLDRYRAGQWFTGHSWQFVLQRGTGGEEPTLPRRYGPGLPDFGPRQYFLTFAAQPRRAGGLPLADPVLLRPGQDQLPVLFKGAEAGLPAVFFFEHQGVLVPTNPRDRGEYEYQQVTLPPPVDEPNLSHPVEVERQYVSFLRWIASGSQLPTWADALLDRLADRPGYPVSAEDVRLVRQYRQALRDDHEAAIDADASRAQQRVAQALALYLSSSGEYAYTLELRRDDPEADPTEEFLMRIKQGHCERFAGALALLLRTQAIPARVVKGYRGADNLGDGSYLVRNSHAHAWVEALVWRPGAGGAPEPRWLTLDPTPGGEVLDAAPFSWWRWWEYVQRVGSELWKDIIINYDPDIQQNIVWELDDRLGAARHWQALVAAPARRYLPGGMRGLSALLVLAAAVAAAWWLARRARLRRREGWARGRGHFAPFYARLLVLLERHARLGPTPAQTPREVAETARHWLAGDARTAPLADLPAQVADLYYRVRFGRLPLTESEQADVDDRLDRLASVMAARA
jgi:hypothetical protein